MKHNDMEQDILKILYSEEEIRAKVRELGEAIYREYAGQSPLFVCVMKGSLVFTADLLRACPLKSELEGIAVSSYHNGTDSSGQVRITWDLKRSIEGKTVILVEDILDSGNTLSFLKETFLQRGAKEVRIVTLLDKPARRTKTVAADWVGFSVPDEFVVGYGLDFAQGYRNLPYIGVLKPEIYQKET